MQFFYHIFWGPRIVHLLNKDFTTAHLMAVVYTGAFASLLYQEFWRRKYKKKVSQKLDSFEEDERVFKKITNQLYDFYSAIIIGIPISKKDRRKFAENTKQRIIELKRLFQKNKREHGCYKEFFL